MKKKNLIRLKRAPSGRLFSKRSSAAGLRLKRAPMGRLCRLCSPRCPIRWIRCGWMESDQLCCSAHPRTDRSCFVWSQWLYRQPAVNRKVVNKIEPNGFFCQNKFSATHLQFKRCVVVCIWYSSLRHFCLGRQLPLNVWRTVFVWLLRYFRLTSTNWIRSWLEFACCVDLGEMWKWRLVIPIKKFNYHNPIWKQINYQLHIVARNETALIFFVLGKPPGLFIFG